MTTIRPPLSRTRRIALVAALAALPLGSAMAETTTSAATSATASAATTTAVVVEAVPVVQPLPVSPEPAAPAPAAPAARSLGSGVASFYGAELHGRRTANGERFDMHQLTAAHRTLPFGTRVMVTNPANGRSVTVRINDRGPFHGGRVIDVSRAAANALGLIARGHGKVELAVIEG